MDAVYGLLIGFFASILAGMFGSGGGVVTTPAIRVLLGASPAVSLGTTLPVAIPAALSGTVRYWRAGFLNKKVISLCAAFGIAGSVAGSLLTAVLNLHYLMLATGAIIMYVSAVTMYQGISGRIPKSGNGAGSWDLGSQHVDSPSSKPKSQDPAPNPHAFVVTALIGLAGGFASGILGIGGGIIFVPSFIYVLRLPIKEAFGNSLAVIALVAIPGTIIHAFLGHISGWLLVYMLLGALPGGFIGAALAVRTKERVLYILFSVFLAAFGIIFIVNEIKCLVS